MAGKGGADDSGGVGGALSDIGSFLGNAFIPQTMDHFRAIDQGQRSSLVRSAVANELKNADGAVGSPTYYDYSKVLDGGPRTVKQAATPLMDDQTAAGALHAAMPDAFNAAMLKNRIAKMFPTPPSEDEIPGTPGGVGGLNVRPGDNPPGVVEGQPAAKQADVNTPRGTVAPQPNQAAPSVQFPPGMVRQVGTYQGKPVYVDAQGQRHVVTN